MRFRVLGPVEVAAAGRLVPLARRRERCLLGVLLLHPHRVVTVERLAELLWDGEPPDRARRAVHSHVSRLRAALTAASAGDPTDQQSEIATVRDGYRLDTDPETVDAHEFQLLLDRAPLATDPAARADRLRTAVDLWRGPALADASAWLRDRLCADLEERRLNAIEELMAVSLTLRRERAVLPELARLSSAHAGREELTALHMQALYQAGRKPDALELYRRARAHLAEELGLDPGQRLRQVHHAILRDQLPIPGAPTATIAVAASGQPSRAGSPLPRQLPIDVAGFTGRADELDQLDALLAGTPNQSTAVVICAVAGTAGVGKTALAVHWAHRVVDRFPDGQLYLNLRGYDPGQPVTAADALARVLAALGVDGQDLPLELDERAARYRSEVAGQRMLIVLDNAGSVEQVRPLLPGSAACVVVVTSRDSLAGLVAVDGAHRLELDLLPPADAIALLRRLIGLRVDAEPEAASMLAELCARLPLAVRIAAELAVANPDLALAELVAELANQQVRLDRLTGGGDPHATVRAVLSWSIRHLSPAAACTFQLLGLHPGPDIDPYAAAALVGTDLDQTQNSLDSLARAHLVHPTGPGRFGMHDLLRAYAAELTRAQNTPQARQASLTRLLDHYRHTASVAVDTAYPNEHAHRPQIPAARTPTPDLPDPASALGWLDAELPNLLPAADHASNHGWPEHTWHLAATLHRHLHTRGHYHHAETLHYQELATARAAGNRAGEVDALIGLSSVEMMQGRHSKATGRFEQALELARAIGDRVSEAKALRGLGTLHMGEGRFDRAVDEFEQVLKITRPAGDWSSETHALRGLGWIRGYQGRYSEAIDRYHEALQLARRERYRIGELHALNGLGHILRRQGRHGEAFEHHQKALALARTSGHRIGELNALTGLGNVHRAQERHREAASRYHQVIDIAREIDNNDWQFEALQGLGRLHHTTGQPQAAYACHHKALELAIDLRQPTDQARAHDGLAHAHHALGQLEQARQHWQRALDILTGLGLEHTEDTEATAATIRGYLDDLVQPVDRGHGR